MRVFPDWKSCEGSVPSQLGGVEDDATPGHSRGWSDTSAGRVAAEAGSSRTSDCKRSKRVSECSCSMTAFCRRNKDCACSWHCFGPRHDSVHQNSVLLFCDDVCLCLDRLIGDIAPAAGAV